MAKQVGQTALREPVVSHRTLRIIVGMLVVALYAIAGISMAMMNSLLIILFFVSLFGRLDFWSSLGYVVLHYVPFDVAVVLYLPLYYLKKYMDQKWSMPFGTSR